MAANMGTTVPSTYKLGTSQVSSLYQGTTKVWPTTLTGNFSIKLYVTGSPLVARDAYMEVGVGNPVTSIYWTSSLVNISTTSDICYDFGNVTPAIANNGQTYVVQLYKPGRLPYFCTVSAINKVGYGSCPTASNLVSPFVSTNTPSTVINGTQPYAYPGQSLVFTVTGLQ